MSRRRARTDVGAAAVEFALVAPFVLMLLIGMVWTALAYNDHLSASNSVREAARLGAALDYAPSPGDWATSVRTRVNQTYFNNSPVADDKICVKLVDSSNTLVTGASAVGANCGTEPDAPTGMAAGSCAVKVWMSKPESIVLLIFPTINFNIGAKSVAYYGRTTGSCTAQ